ncbi:MAG: hypothetical protein ACM3XM_00965 [Mycobacterium leprae]
MPGKVIDLYLGFMDEEVNVRLQEVLKAEVAKPVADQRPVILIERNKVEDADPILQWPPDQYPCAVERLIPVSPTVKPNRWPRGAEPDLILARALLVFMEQGNEPLKQGTPDVHRYFEFQAMLNNVPKDTKPKTSDMNGGPWLTVIRFDVGLPTNPPIIVIRSPEMGLQPGLICGWLEFLLRMLSPLSSQLAAAAKEQVEWPIRVSCFGAAGATQGTRPPGTPTDICASLFVGVEYNNGVPASVIRLQTFQRTYTFFVQPNTSTEEPALNAFRGETPLRTITVADEQGAYWGTPEPDVIKGIGVPLTDVIQQVKATYGKEVSMTASFFVQSADKQVAGRLGLDSCGMEDAHVIRILRRCANRRFPQDEYYPLLDPANAFITRINCDPHTIDPHAADAFKRVISNPRLTCDDYIQLMEWGQKGVLSTEVPACAHWRIVNDDVFQGWAGHRLLQQQLYTFVTQEQSVVADPFCVEIATDFLTDLAKGTAFGNDEVPKSIQLKAKELRAAWRLPDSQDLRRGLARELTDLLSGTERFGTQGGLKTWIRPGKWSSKWTRTYYTLEDLNASGEEFDGAAIDRAFYKSSNIMALRAMAGQGLLR